MSCNGLIGYPPFNLSNKVLKKQENKKVMSTRKFKNGETVVVTDKVSRYEQQTHGTKPGDVGIVVDYRYDGYYQVKLKSGRLITEKTSAFSKETPKTSKESFLEQIEKAQEKIKATNAFIAETQSKLAFLEETGSDSFDENEFKAFHTLTIIEQSDMSKIEKARAIASLIAGK